VVPNQEKEQLEQQEQLQLQQQEQQQNSAADGQAINRHGCKTDINLKRHIQYILDIYLDIYILDLDAQ
jgi:hypothetical protein